MSLDLLEELEEGNDAKAKKGGPSLVVFLAVCAVITLVAGGAGFAVSATMLEPVTMAAAPVENTTPAAKPADDGHGAPAAAHGADAGHGDAGGHDETAMDDGQEHSYTLSPDDTVADISPITTNLLDPEETWIRMELSLAFKDGYDEALAEEIHQDILTYVHTLKLYNLRGGSGFQHLLEDLNERAAIRSEGRVKRVLVRSFILE